MTVPDVNAPTIGEHGAPCAVCAAPLAGDQRYCLECGHRRAETRLPFREILATNAALDGARPGAPSVPAGPARPAMPADDGHRSGLVALASLGCLLLALGVGVLIGGAGDSSTSAPAPAPQVISVGGTTGAAGAAPADTSGTDTTAKGGGTAKKSGGSSSGGTPTKQKQQLKQLEKLTPSQYQKQSQKLPKVVGTGGAPPPKDNKPAAGGGSFQEIG